MKTHFTLSKFFARGLVAIFVFAIVAHAASPQPNDPTPRVGSGGEFSKSSGREGFGEFSTRKRSTTTVVGENLKPSMVAASENLQSAVPKKIKSTVGPTLKWCAAGLVGAGVIFQSVWLRSTLKQISDERQVETFASRLGTNDFYGKSSVEEILDRSNATYTSSLDSVRRKALVSQLKTALRPFSDSLGERDRMLEYFVERYLQLKSPIANELNEFFELGSPSFRLTYLSKRVLDPSSSEHWIGLFADELKKNHKHREASFLLTQLAEQAVASPGPERTSLLSRLTKAAKVFEVVAEPEIFQYLRQLLPILRLSADPLERTAILSALYSTGSPHAHDIFEAGFIIELEELSSGTTERPTIRTQAHNVGRVVNWAMSRGYLPSKNVLARWKSLVRSSDAPDIQVGLGTPYLRAAGDEGREFAMKAYPTMLKEILAMPTTAYETDALAFILRKQITDVLLGDDLEMNRFLIRTLRALPSEHARKPFYDEGGNNGQRYAAQLNELLNLSSIFRRLRDPSNVAASRDAIDTLKEKLKEDSLDSELKNEPLLFAAIAGNRAAADRAVEVMATPNASRYAQKFFAKFVMAANASRSGNLSLNENFFLGLLKLPPSTFEDSDLRPVIELASNHPSERVREIGFEMRLRTSDPKMAKILLARLQAQLARLRAGSAFTWASRKVSAQSSREFVKNQNLLLVSSFENLQADFEENFRFLLPMLNSDPDALSDKEIAELLYAMNRVVFTSDACHDLQKKLMGVLRKKTL